MPVVLTESIRTAILAPSFHLTIEDTMLNASSEGLTRKQARSLQSLVGGQLIHVSEHVSRSQHSARFIACTAPFLSCKSSIMEGNGGIPRCNSPFLHCKRYVFEGELCIHAGAATEPGFTMPRGK